MLSIILVLVRSVVLTILIESIVAFLLGLRGKKNFIKLAIINIITNLSLNYIYMIYSTLISETIVVVIILELLLPFIEGKMVKKYINYVKINPYIFTLIINASSFIFGLIVFEI